MPPKLGAGGRALRAAVDDQHPGTAHAEAHTHIRGRAASEIGLRASPGHLAGGWAQIRAQNCVWLRPTSTSGTRAAGSVARLGSFGRGRGGGGGRRRRRHRPPLPPPTASLLGGPAASMRRGHNNRALQTRHTTASPPSPRLPPTVTPPLTQRRLVADVLSPHLPVPSWPSTSELTTTAGRWRVAQVTLQPVTAVGTLLHPTGHNSRWLSSTCPYHAPRARLLIERRDLVDIHGGR